MHRYSVPLVLGGAKNVQHSERSDAQMQAARLSLASSVAVAWARDANEVGARDSGRRGVHRPRRRTQPSEPAAMSMAAVPCQKACADVSPVSGRFFAVLIRPAFYSGL